MRSAGESRKLLGQPLHSYNMMLSLWAIGVIIYFDWLRDTANMVVALVTSSVLLQTIANIWVSIFYLGIDLFIQIGCFDEAV
jgi:hypothetical protein